MARSLAGPPGTSKWGVGMEIAMFLRNLGGPRAGPSGARAGPPEDSERQTGAAAPLCRPVDGGWNALEPHSNRLPIDNIAAVNVNTFPWRVK
jgi:hypothetical protein